MEPVEYKGEPLEAARGPGLGCFWLQLVVLGIFVVLTPLTVAAGWSPIVSAVLLFAVILLLLFTGQTMIFLLRLVAAGRSEGRRRPLASSSPTVGELEDEAHEAPLPAPGEDARVANAEAPAGDHHSSVGDDDSGMPQ